MMTSRPLRLRNEWIGDKMKFALIGLIALFAISAFAYAALGPNGTTSDNPPQLPQLCYDNSDCASGYACVNDTCVLNGSSGGDGGSGGGGGGGNPPNRGRDWNWSGWDDPSRNNSTSSPPANQNNSTVRPPAGNQEPPPNPPSDNSGNTGKTKTAADVPTQIAQGIGDFLSAMLGDIGRNPVVIGIAAAIALFAGLLVLLGAYVYFVRKK